MSAPPPYSSDGSGDASYQSGYQSAPPTVVYVYQGAPPQGYAPTYAAAPYAQQYNQTAVYTQQTHANTHHAPHHSKATSHPDEPPHDAAAVHHSGADKFSSPQCRDAFWAILFYVHLLAMIILAFVLFHIYHNDLDSSNDDPNERSDELRLNGKAWGLILILIGMNVAMAAAWLEAFKRYATELIWFGLFLSPAMMFAFSLFLFIAHEPIAGVFALLIGLLGLIYIYFVRDRIPFSAAILRIVVSVLKQFPNTSAVAYGSILFQVAWVIVWCIAAACAMHGLKNKSNDSGVGIIWFFLLVSFYWTAQVIKNVVHCTTAGALATWYFLAPNNMPSSPVLGSLKRATWSSFGSICLGSLIIAIVKAFRAVVRQFVEAEHPIVRCIVMCILNTLDWLCEYFNLYAFTLIAIYGKSYVNAASDAWNLLSSSGVYALINDNLIDSVLFFACLANGILSAGVGALLAKFVFDLGMWGLWSLVAGLIGLFLTSVALEVVSSGVVSFFVCYSEDPAVLQATKPDVYAAMADAQDMYRALGRTTSRPARQPLLG